MKKLTCTFEEIESSQDKLSIYFRLKRNEGRRFDLNQLTGANSYRYENETVYCEVSHSCHIAVCHAAQRSIDGKLWKTCHSKYRV